MTTTRRVERVLGHLSASICANNNGIPPRKNSSCGCDLELGHQGGFMHQAASQEVDTPALCVSLSRLTSNVNAMQARADEHKVKLRPHCKTHKTLQIAQMQVARGAKGICVAKVDEAVIYAKAGFDDILIAYPLLSPFKLDRLFELSTSPKLSVIFRFVVTSVAGVEALEKAAARWPVKAKSVPVFIKIDVGLHRVGVSADSPELLLVAQRLSQANSPLTFLGLLSHAGHAYAAANREEVIACCEKERLLLLRVKGRLQQEGLTVREVSVGSTPTELCRQTFEGITEIRPGNYVFCDMTPMRLGLIPSSQVSLLILAQVVSVNDEWIIIDAGSKVLSSDKGAHGMSNAAAYAVARILQANGAVCGCGASQSLLVERVSEEHGWIKRPAGLEVALQSRVVLCPAHACPAVNLAKELIVVDDNNSSNKQTSKLVEWDVIARSSSH